MAGYSRVQTLRKDNSFIRLDLMFFLFAIRGYSLWVRSHKTVKNSGDPVAIASADTSLTRFIL
jgi:hypothetical protein